jgi:hypothetical protein
LKRVEYVEFKQALYPKEHASGDEQEDGEPVRSFKLGCGACAGSFAKSHRIKGSSVHGGQARAPPLGTTQAFDGRRLFFGESNRISDRECGRALPILEISKRSKRCSFAVFFKDERA